MTAPAAAAPAPASVGRMSALAARRRGWNWRGLAVSFALVAAASITLNLQALRSPARDPLIDEVVASHVRSTLGTHLVDVASSDHHTVKPWLSSKLDFSPPVHELHLPDCEFVGGRVDYLDGHPVAALVYRKGRHIVNTFVWPTAGKDSAAQFSSERGFHTARWAQAGMTHWVVSDIDREEFRSVVGAVQAVNNER